MTNYAKYVNPRGKRILETEQVEAIPGREEDMKQNNAGGFSFVVNDWDRLDRFLILGSEGGTYYVSERKLTVENAKTVNKLIAEDGVRVVNRVVEISDAGRAPKNDAALFVLAMCTASKSVDVRRAAIAALPKVARIGTHLFHFAEFVQGFRGWGRALRNGVANWYNCKDNDQLLNQLVKYQSRDGWSHRDLLRLSHPQTNDEVRNFLYKYAVGSADLSDAAEMPDTDNNTMQRLLASDQLLHETDPHEAVKLITEFGLPREVVNTTLLNDVGVWEALLEHMPITAMMRNLAKMTAIGLLKANNSHVAKVVDTLQNVEILKKGRIHPLNVLVAMTTYGNGHGDKGSLTWEPVRDITDALEDAFYASFDVVTPTNKRWLLGIDVSGSMTGACISGMSNITANIAAAAMAMVTARTEKRKQIMGFAHEFRDLGVSAKDSLEAVIKKTNDMSFGGTDCALPMTYALQKKIEVDAFVVYTDSETWAGHSHPVQALQQYRQKMGIPAKLIVVGMTATEVSIADPNDAGMMDVVGFDTATPDIMADFVRDEEKKA